ncbi:astacin-like metalloprotease toxin 5 isoform X1 [Parasteatoda tepidariorum]|uniref:astacin-like metalloprotease toxin 5 isoform X1 n=1 Tax=Parasteatoda tepidariorum TaxID=114398 RepID=UPI0039BC4540
MNIFYILVFLTTTFALPFPEDLDNGLIQMSDIEEEIAREAMTNPDLLGGDMLGVKEILEADRNGRRGKQFRWPNAVVPYVIEDDINDKKMKLIDDAISYYRENTCVRFVPRTDEEYYITIYNGSRCTSYVGKQELDKQPQPLSLTDGCDYVGTIMHEFMHALGFYHEHSRSDRDEYVEIRLENADEKMHGQFFKLSKALEVRYTGYDYDSIMTYGSKSFSNNGKDTIVPLQKGVVLVDAFKKFKMTKSDLKRVNRMYKCQV